MVTVTQFCKANPQSGDGLLPLDMWKGELQYPMELIPVTNMTPHKAMTQGLVVEYFTEIMYEHTHHPETDFTEIVDCTLAIAHKGDYLFESDRGNVMNKWKQPEYRLDSLIQKIKGMDTESIRAMWLAVQWDNVYRRGELLEDPDTLRITESICNNIRLMVIAGVDYLDKNSDGLTHGGVFADRSRGIIAYSDVITKGDYDFCNRTKVIDFKTSRFEPTPEMRLQVFIYYLLGSRKIYGESIFPDSVQTLALFSPMTNVEWTLEVKDIPQDVFDKVVAMTQLENVV